MEVKLTNTTKKHNSTEVPTFTKTVTCMLKEGSSIINPTLIFERANIGHTYNYVYIADFGRYYFVNDIVYDGARIFYYCSVDVLATYKSTIGNASAYVLRAAHEYNEFAIDTYYPVTTRILPYKDQLNFGTALVPFYSPWYDFPDSRGKWVVGVINEKGVTYYCFTKTNYAGFLKYLLSDAFMQAMGVDLSVNPQLRVAADPIQYLTCCFWLPFSTGTRFTDEAVTVADGIVAKEADGVTSIQAGNISAGSGGFTLYDLDITIAPHPQSNARGEYLNSSGFTECRLVFPPFGSFQLDPAELNRFERVRCMVQVDCTTAIGKLLLYGYVGASDALPSTTLITAEAQVGIPMPITQIITPGVSPVQLGMQAIGAVASLAEGNISGAITGGYSAITSYQMGKIQKPSVIGSRGSLAAIHGYAFMEYVFAYVTDNDVADHGQPLCAVRQLSTLPGYQMIQEPHIHTTGTSAEDEQINSYLSSGYFYE